MRNPDVIIVGDIHARDDQPACRLDNFWDTQVRKFQWLRELWEKYDRPKVIQPGDLFHRWKSNPRVISAVMNHLPPMITIPGNPGKHNYYNEEGFERDALYVIQSSFLDWEVMAEFGGMMMLLLYDKFIVHSCLWGQSPPNMKYKDRPNVLLTHRMILDGPAAFDGENGYDFLRGNQGFDLIVSGHNHKPMEFNLDTKHGPIHLINPGSFTRQTAAETHKPRVYLWWAEENGLEPVFVPIDEEVISRNHIDLPKERDERIAKFAETLANSSIDVTIDFMRNIINALGSDEIREAVRLRVMEAVDE